MTGQVNASVYEQQGDDTGDKLTIEEIDAQESFRNLSYEQKLELISLIYDIGLALYNAYYRLHE